MDSKNLGFLAVVFLMVSVFSVSAEKAAEITMLEGEASVLRDGSSEWREARNDMPLMEGDALYSREESFVEVRYANGAIVRLGEETKIIIKESTEKKSSTNTLLGKIWVNMKKLISRDKDFELSSPTAVAAIRGTKFRMDTRKDSSTDVRVFSGEVAVGPSDKDTSKSREDNDNEGKEGEKVEDPHEVPGPEEVPGPYEVPLEEWRSIVAGQMISVRSDGMFAEKEIDEEDSFTKRNKELDKKEKESKPESEPDSEPKPD